MPLTNALTPPPAPPPGGTGHAERVFRVQKAFTTLEGDVHGPGALAKATGLDDSAVYRILQSGVYQGLFERVGHGRYRLGMNTAVLGIHALSHAPSDAAHSVLEHLRAATGGLAMLYTLAPFGGAQRLCIDMAVGESDLVELGMTPREVLSITRSLRTGASGRTILAFLPDTIQRRVLTEPVPPEAGPGAIRDNAQLARSLQEIRDNGYALGHEECMAGWNSCAAPVMREDTIMGAVLLLRPTTEMPRAPHSTIQATLRAAAHLTRICTQPLE
ncbi:IclR family transcriptional regulator [Streptomyces sedi]|uniref:IclR family transcriptional regulator n=1 Tax=Streptomyces sedi TaxID=555059 RepID=A0A5C4UQY5_9ACTN|nr:IclR family transcriptional regulator C-terminal domain-containing protein [Streptomyces sedi]TNM25835.1 IclR family transcriptional regulator [Streptomyces sedi]